MNIFMRPFGFEGLNDFFSSSLRYNDLEIITPLTIFLVSLKLLIFDWFGIQYMEMVALIVLFILEIFSGIWASSVNYQKHISEYEKKKDVLSESDCCELKFKIEKYKFSSTKLKRAGAVMGFWLIIIFIIHQFSLDAKGTISAIFDTAHFIFLSYMISIYIVSVIENGITISGNREKYLPLKNAIRNIFMKNSKHEEPNQ